MPERRATPGRRGGVPLRFPAGPRSEFPRLGSTCARATATDRGGDRESVLIVQTAAYGEVIAFNCEYLTVWIDESSRVESDSPSLRPDHRFALLTQPGSGAMVGHDFMECARPPRAVDRQAKAGPPPVRWQWVRTLHMGSPWPTLRNRTIRLATAQNLVTERTSYIADLACAVSSFEVLPATARGYTFLRVETDRGVCGVRPATLLEA
jgi:hypothetical protein